MLEKLTGELEGGSQHVESRVVKEPSRKLKMERVSANDILAYMPHSSCGWKKQDGTTPYAIRYFVIKCKRNTFKLLKSQQVSKQVKESFFKLPQIEKKRVLKRQEKTTKRAGIFKISSYRVETEKNLAVTRIEYTDGSEIFKEASIVELT